VLETYPAGADLCKTKTEVIEVLADGKWSVKIPAGTPLLRGSDGNLVLVFPLECYGVQVTLNVPVTIQGKTYPAGTKLTLDKDNQPPPFQTVESTPISIFTVEDITGVWDVPQDLKWIEVSSWD
jgi:hypothetical protein